MAEMTVRIEGANPTTGALPVAISGTLPPGTALPVAQAAPALASAPLVGNVLAASALGDQTLFSMTAGQIWYGYFTLSGSLVGISLNANASISCLGGSSTPAAGTLLLSMDLATGTTGSNATQAVVGNYMYIYAGASDNDVHADVTGAAANITATAYGYLLA